MATLYSLRSSVIAFATIVSLVVWRVVVVVVACFTPLQLNQCKLIVGEEERKERPAN